MTLPVFVVDRAALAAEAVELAGAEGRHAAAAKRLRAGERVMLTDGTGNGAECEVLAVGRHGLSAKVLVRREEPPPQPRLVVVQAIPKGDHAERAVDLLTEVGVDVIIPWAASRNVVRWQGERAEKALRRWRSTAQAAAKQSRRLWHPAVRDVHSTAEVVELVAGAAASFVLHETAGQPLSGVVLPAFDRVADASAGGERQQDVAAESGSVVLVVGPEGGVTADELGTFRAAGAVPVRLGPEVLRSSSAGMAAAAVILSRTPRWS